MRSKRSSKRKKSLKGLLNWKEREKRNREKKRDWKKRSEFKENDLKRKRTGLKNS